MGFLDYLGDAAKGAADAMLVDMERQAREKHDTAMANKAIEREQAMTFLRGRQERKLNEQNLSAAAAEADARRKAERDEKNEARKWDREKLTATEAGRDRRAALSANRAGATAQPKPEKFQLPNGKIVWITPGQDPGDAVPWERGRNSSGSADDWLSQF